MKSKHPYKITTEPHPCSTPRCRNIVPASCRSKICSRCKNRLWAKQNPMRYSYGNLRRRAKERGHEFTLTFEQYCDFSKKTGYFEKKGKTAQSLSINRIDPNRGYHADNIEAVTLSYNSRLRFSAIPDWYKQQILEPVMSQSTFTAVTGSGTD